MYQPVRTPEKDADLCLGHSDASVADPKFDDMAILKGLLDLRPYCDLAMLSKLHGIVAEVDQDLPAAADRL